MRHIDWLAIAATAALAIAAASARAEEAPAPESDAERLERLERRVEELEQEEQSEPAPEPEADEGLMPGAAYLPEWAQRVRLGGSASVGYFRRGQLTPSDSDAFEVWDARVFVDAELAEDVAVADTKLVRNIGATFEWDLVRI